MSTPEPSPSAYSGALDGIVKRLHDQPPLLYGLGAAILIVALAGAVRGIAAEQLWMLVGALVLLVLAALGAWLVVERQPEAPPHEVLTVGGNAVMKDRAQALVDKGDSATFTPEITVGGNLDMSGDTKLGVRQSGDDAPRQRRRRRARGS